jgi:dihydroxyacetone kinase
MKTLINSPESVLQEMLDGLAVLDPGLARLENFPVLLRADAGRACATRSR